MTRHFLRDDDLSPKEQRAVLKLALQFKRDRFHSQPFVGPQAVAVLFDKPSTRTRVSFAAGIAELGGHPLMIDAGSSQMGRGESISDTARVFERQVSAIVWRTFEQARIEEMAENSSVPVINALTNEFHPCQVLADLAAVAFTRGGVEKLKGLTLSYLGDGANNMAHSYLLGGATAGMHVRIGTPPERLPTPTFVEEASAIAQETGGSVAIMHGHDEAATGADVIATDTWVSMGDEDTAAASTEFFEPFQVSALTLGLANSDAQVLHCLPAYRGKEITADVMDGPQSIVWDEAEFRLHAQKALLSWLVNK